jgi:periplasmic protein CpxP/Spy
MKAKSIIMLVTLILFTMSIQSFAQMGGNPQDRLKKNLEDYKTRLKLTDAQFTKVDSILTSQMNEMTKIREEANGDFSAMREKMTPLREKTDKSVEALLTDEQKVEFKKILDERAERMRSMMRN